MANENESSSMTGTGCLGVLLAALAGGGFLVKGLARFGDDAVRVAVKPLAGAGTLVDDTARGSTRVLGHGGGSTLDDAGRAAASGGDNLPYFGARSSLNSPVASELLRCRARTVHVQGKLANLHAHFPLHAARLTARLTAADDKRAQAEQQFAASANPADAAELHRVLLAVEVEQLAIEQEIASMNVP